MVYPVVGPAIGVAACSSAAAVRGPKDDRKARKLRRMSNGAELPDDVETLRALLVEARARLAERDLEIEQLKAQLDKLRRMQFGQAVGPGGCTAMPRTVHQDDGVNRPDGVCLKAACP